MTSPSTQPIRVDIAVVGGGHAGIEAAAAAARMGARVAMVTLSLDGIGRLSCNPAMGGLAKGQLAKEVDALGGLMGVATDRAGIQFRVLNASRGPAVRAPRAQVDRGLYPIAVRELLIEQGGDRLVLVEGEVAGLIVENGAPADRVKLGAHAQLRGIVLRDGREVRCGAVVVTTGTFLRGLMHRGKTQTAGGRTGEAPANALSGELTRVGFKLGRLKTGTPPRLDARTIDFADLEPQPGDADPEPFSFTTPRPFKPALPQVDCWLTHTTADAHELIRANLHRAPMYTGQIEAVGPRYCPSIEDKVVRFPDKERHQVFLEPDGVSERWAHVIYANGISTSLPDDVQDVIVHSLRGCERATILNYGYAVEYDFVPTDQTDATLHSKPVAGLFLAGQINGTSGYEEAAAQGLIAGVNATLWTGWSAADALALEWSAGGPPALGSRDRWPLLETDAPLRDGCHSDRPATHGANAEPAGRRRSSLIAGVNATLWTGWSAADAPALEWSAGGPPALGSRDRWPLLETGAPLRDGSHSDERAVRHENAEPAGRRRSSLILGRDEAYIGVLVDDLVTRVPTEPYRMFTSRAEHRLKLRGDTAELRLADTAHKLGLIDDARYDRVCAQRARLEAARDWLTTTTASHTLRADYDLDGGSDMRLTTVLRRPVVTLADIAARCTDVATALDNRGLDLADRALLEADIKYDGYVKRQDQEMQSVARYERITLPPDLDYTALRHLRAEARQRLASVRPRTLAQASRLAGVTPADCAVLLVHLRQQSGL